MSNEIIQRWDGAAWVKQKVYTSATDRLLGRDSASAGPHEELTVGGGVEFTGSGGIQRSALTGDVTASAGSGTTTLANSGVTAATYGSATQVAVITVDAKGRATAISNTTIAIGSSAVTPPGSTTQVFFNNAGAWGASADLVFDDSTDKLGINGGATTATGHVHMTVDAGGNGVVTQNQNTTLTGYAYRHFGSAGEQYFYINAAGTPRSYYTTCQLIGFEHPNYTGCIDFFTSSSNINFRVGTPSGGSGTAPVRGKLSSVGVLTLYYDGSNYTTFTPSSSGELDITPSGGTATVTGILKNTVGGATARVARGLSANSADSSAIASTAVETNFDQNYTVPAGLLNTVRNTIRVVASGRCSSTGTPTLQLKLKAGSTTLIDIGALTLGSGVTNRPWAIDAIVTCRATGGSGTLSTTVQTQRVDGRSGNAVRTDATVDLTASFTLQVSATWGTSSASNTTTLETLVVEAVNC